MKKGGASRAVLKKESSARAPGLNEPDKAHKGRALSADVKNGLQMFHTCPEATFSAGVRERKSKKREKEEREKGKRRPGGRLLRFIYGRF